MWRESEDAAVSNALPQFVVDDLARSGIPPELAAAAGIRPLEPTDYAGILGFELPDMPPGYGVPYCCPDTGEPMKTRDGREFIRVRLERPVCIDGSDAKYLSPKNAGNHAYIPPTAHEAALHGEPVAITEGEKKALCATINGIATIGLVGAFGFTDGKTKDLIADLQPYINAGRDVTFVLDSDAAVNHDLALAAHRLSECARLRGCTLSVTVLPPHFEGGGEDRRTVKVGMDDLVMRDGVGRLREVLAAASPINGSVDDVYVDWLTEYARLCNAAGVAPSYLAREILAKGYFDKTHGATRRRILAHLDETFPELVQAIDARVHERLDVEFTDTPAPAHGGENLAARAYVNVHGCADRLRIDSIQADVVWCFNPGSKHCSRPYPRRLVELAPRVPAGAQNGQLGGRPAAPSVTDITNAFLAQPQFFKDNTCLLRVLRGQWYEYDARCYRKIREDDVSSMVMHFMRQHPVFSDRATTKTLNDVMNQLKARDAAGLPSDLQPPVWLAAAGPTPANDWLVCANKAVNIAGMIRMHNGEHVPDTDIAVNPTPRLFSTTAIEYNFDPDASCPKFEQFLMDILPDPDVREAVQMMVGLCLVPDTTYNVFFFLVGPAGTGKSTFLHILLALVGKDNVCHLPFTRFSEKFSVGLLTEHLVNLIGEGDTELPRHIGLGRVEGVLKDITDGGMLPVERKFHEPGMARATARCVAAANALPTFYDRSDAIWDRLCVIPFEVRKRGADDENRRLRHEIVAEELPGIFNWAVEGLAKLRRLHRFPETARGKELKEAHRAACDHEREFLEDTCVEDPSAPPLGTQALYTEYRSWMGARGYHHVGEAKFVTHVQRVFPGAVRRRARDDAGKQFRAWVGIRRREDVE